MTRQSKTPNRFSTIGYRSTPSTWLTAACAARHDQGAVDGGQPLTTIFYDAWLTAKDIGELRYGLCSG
jgi:hypothetical protein